MNLCHTTCEIKSRGKNLFLGVQYCMPLIHSRDVEVLRWEGSHKD